MSRLRRKGSSAKAGGSGPTKKQKTLDLGYNDDDDHIDSEEEEDLQAPSDDEDVEEEETLDAKKVRLARQYLRKLEADESDESSDEDEDDEQDEHDRIGVKLQRERLRLEGNLETAVADKVDNSLNQLRSSLETESSTTVDQEAKEWVEAGHVKLLRGHDLSPTCVALQDSGAKAVSGSKDHSVILWDVENECKDILLCKSWKSGSETAGSRTQGEILSIACSDDDRYVAIGKRDATVSIFDIRADKNNLVTEFTGHKGPITCLAFRMQTLQLFSGSEDRCIRYVGS
jgi:ribosomal RNA-processing protein 9